MHSKLINEFPDRLFLHHNFNQLIMVLRGADHPPGADDGALGLGLVVIKDLQCTVFESLVDLFKTLYVPGTDHDLV